MTGAETRRPLLWGMVLAAAVAASLYALREDHPAHEHAEAVELLVPVPPAEMAAVEVLKAGQLTRFDRAEDGAWFLHPDAQGHAADARAGHAHAGTPDAAERIGKALAMFSRTRVERHVGPVGEERRRFGLLFPDLVVAVYTAGRAQPALRFEVGDLAPDGLSRYVLLTERGVVVTIPNYHVANLAALLDGKG